MKSENNNPHKTIPITSSQKLQNWIAGQHQSLARHKLPGLVTRSMEGDQKETVPAEVFKNFVFLDLEATGLRGSLPRITELALVSVTVPELAKLHKCLSESKSSNLIGHQPDDVIMPRVMNKLTLCFYPGVRMTLHVSDLTGEKANAIKLKHGIP